MRTTFDAGAGTVRGTLRLPPAIRTTGLTREFSGLRAVDDLDLEVQRGSIFGFLGPNGAGKTTTVRLLLGLIPPTKGRAEVLGFDVATQADEIRKRSGVLLEHPGLSERLNAEENLDLYGRIWRLPKRVRQTRIRELLLELDLWERREARVATWSRGMRQRLAIARTLLHRPSLLFLDEPTAGLDPIAASDLRKDLIRVARREGVTVFLNTHNLAEAERLCDEVAVIQKGRLLSVGPPEALRARSPARRVRIVGKGISDNVIELVGERMEVDGVIRDNGHILVDLRERDQLSTVVSFMVRLGVDVEEVTLVGNSLEEVVLGLVSGAESPGVGTSPARATKPGSPPPPRPSDRASLPRPRSEPEPRSSRRPEPEAVECEAVEIVDAESGAAKEESELLELDVEIEVEEEPERRLPSLDMDFIPPGWKRESA